MRARDFISFFQQFDPVLAEERTQEWPMSFRVWVEAE